MTLLIVIRKQTRSVILSARDAGGRSRVMLEKIARVRVSDAWNGGLVTLGAVLGLVASIMLSLEAYWRALNPAQVFACDVNARLSCSTVAGSWQSTLIQWPDHGGVPNAFLGMIAFTTLVEYGVLLACGVRMPRWVEWLFRAGVVIVLIGSTWLLQQSVFVIGAMCPWCITMDAGAVILAIGAWRQWALETSDDSDDRGDTVMDYMIDSIIDLSDHHRMVITHKHGAARFAAGLESLLASVLILAALALIVMLHYWGVY